MKSTLFVAVAAAVIASPAFAPAFADEATAAPKKERPCKIIKDACEAAGFFRGGHKEGKGLFKDCIAKLKAGQAVTGVTVSTETVSACQNKREGSKTRKQKLGTES